MTEDVVIREEGSPDFAAVHRLNQDAFGPGSPEAGLVDELRDAGVHVPALCLVAERGPQLAGHIFFSEAVVESGDTVLALAPMAVSPDCQRSGIGSTLVRESLRRAAETGYPLVVVLGHPEYYPRFGFEPGHSHGIHCPYEVPPEAWMVHLLPAYRATARGLVRYAEPFDR